MLKELIHDKINEVFLEYQKENHIISGDIHPEDAVELDNFEDALAEFVERVCAYQPKEMPSSYLYRDGEGILINKFYPHITAHQFFSEISRRIAFSDCSNEEVLIIIWQGKEVEYVGWRPNMVFEYKDLDGNVVWDGKFEHLDH